MNTPTTIAACLFPNQISEAAERKGIVKCREKDHAKDVPAERIVRTLESVS